VQDGGFHAWIERNDFGQSCFAPPYDDSHSVGSISCGRNTIVTGSYDAHKSTSPISYFSSAGPTRDGREKPEVSAPGHNVLAAWSRTGDKMTQKSGTSMASPAVTGALALLLAEAKAAGRSLAIAEIRDVIIKTARQSPPAGGNWHNQYGYGRISVSAALARVIPP
jgi:subtilisin family serine protease